MELTDFGKHLIAARVGNGFSQNQLAQAAQLHQSVISAMENGKRLPSLPQMLHLALVLRVPLQRLMTGMDIPGTGLIDIALHLQNIGIADLQVPGALVPGAFRENEDVIALALCGNAPPPQVLEAMPAVLAWNALNTDALSWFADRYDVRIKYRLGWLADIALTIHRGTGFPGGCPFVPHLERLTNIEPPLQEDGLGFSETPQRPPVSARWKMQYSAPLPIFQHRADRLHAMRAERLLGAFRLF